MYFRVYIKNVQAEIVLTENNRNEIQIFTVYAEN